MNTLGCDPVKVMDFFSRIKEKLSAQSGKRREEKACSKSGYHLNNAGRVSNPWPQTKSEQRKRMRFYLQHFKAAPGMKREALRRLKYSYVD